MYLAIHLNGACGVQCGMSRNTKFQKNEGLDKPAFSSMKNNTKEATNTLQHRWRQIVQFRHPLS